MRLRRLVGLAAGVALVACGGGTSTGAPAQIGPLKNRVEVTFWHALSGNLEKGLMQLTDQFNASQDKVHVTLVAKGNYNDLRKSLLTSLAAGSPPDLAQCIGNHAAKYNQSKALADLTPYVNAADGLSKDDLTDIFPVMLNSAKLNGTYYMFPLNKSTTVLYYNQDMFAVKGISGPPATWDEFFKDLHLLADPAAGVVGAESPTLDGWISMLYGYGGQLYDSATNPRKAAFNGEQGVKITRMWQEAIKAGDSRPTSSTPNADQTDFENQKSAIYMATQVSYQFIKGHIGSKFKYAEAPFPGGPNGTKDELFGANACVFSKSSPDVQHGAFLYIKYLTNTQNAATWVKTTSYMPIRQSAFKQLQTDFYPQNPGQDIGVTMLSKGQTFVLPSTPTFDDERDAMTNELNNVWQLRKDPKAALDTAAAKVTDLLTSG